MHMGIDIYISSWEILMPFKKEKENNDRRKNRWVTAATEENGKKKRIYVRKQKPISKHGFYFSTPHLVSAASPRLLHSFF